MKPTTTSVRETYKLGPLEIRTLVFEAMKQRLFPEGIPEGVEVWDHVKYLAPGTTLFFEVTRPQNS